MARTPSKSKASATPKVPTKAPKAPTMKDIAMMALPPGTGSMVKNPLMPAKGKKGAK